MYYELQRQETLIAPYVGETDIYVLDGVGAEYTPLIIELLVINGYEVEYCDYASCHLPSITDVNKEYMASIGYKEWFLDFDQIVIHGEFYKSAINLRKAFDILEEKIRDIVQEADGKKILITAALQQGQSGLKPRKNITSMDRIMREDAVRLHRKMILQIP